MIEIALCDDNCEDIETLKALAEQFALEHSDIPMRLSAFASAKELLAAIEHDGSFDLYILDVLMPEMTGIKLAETLRSTSEYAEIVFLTVSADYAVDAFSVYAGGYLLKPISAEDFDRAVFRAVKRLTNEKNETLTVKTKEGLRKIPLNRIVMIESFNHMREIIMLDDSVWETSDTLSELFERLSGYDRFVMPHRAYIANLDHSVGIVRYDLLMPGDRRIPIPRKNFVEVQKTVQNYFFKMK